MPMKTRTPSLRTQKGESIPSIRLNTSTKDSLEALLREVRACKICSTNLPLGPRPVLQCHASARILIVGQAPGRKVHESGIPFQDASGERLRSWLGITSEIFYDERRVAILPMGFCFPGTGVSGDLPPRPDCAPAWRNELLYHLRSVQLTLVIGQFAQDYHLPNAGSSVAEVVKSWRMHLPSVIPLPHPSPRNNRWFAQNPWFEAELLPVLKERVALSLSDA